jgi:ATP-dependent RNA helicase DDX49/DBP8
MDTKVAFIDSGPTSSGSDDEITHAHNGSRKKRKLTSVMTDSRIQVKGAEPKISNEAPQTNHQVREKTNFACLGVSPWLVAALASMAIKKPTGIQSACIPEILKGRDCIGGSRTGTGKTVAFSVPILQKWSEDPSGIFALILTYVSRVVQH